MRILLRIVRVAIVFFILTFLLQRSTYPLHINWNAVSSIVRDHQFDYVTWEVNALATKAAQWLWGAHPFMDEASRSRYVRDYMVDLEQARQLEQQVETVYIDPDIDDPDAASAVLRDERDALRADLRRRQPVMESILEGQVAAVLVDEDFGVWGQLLPPISMHFTPMPNLLIASPRDEIRFEISINLDPMPLEQQIALEDRIEQERDMSALIVPLGGMALFPAMINETTSIPWAVETFAHEWLHHYLFFFPLGWNYDFSGEARIINETVADLFGKVIAEIVLARYYPEFVQPQTAGLIPVTLSSTILTQPAFDFGAEMHRTRTQVDAIMDVIASLRTKSEFAVEQHQDLRITSIDAAVRRGIEKAEVYMEARRELFFENGYRIRRLNQAYFAFYGGYQGGIPGIGGQDPIGPAVQTVLDASPSLHDFVVTMRTITTRERLLEIRETMVREREQSG